MNKITSIFIGLLLACTWVLFSCTDNYENYSSDPQHRLYFSHDTLSFDTLLSTIGSSTQKITVYNPHKKPVLISAISVVNYQLSGFRVNVDGQASSTQQFTDIEVRQNDSITIFIEATLKENYQNVPISILDSLQFITNNNKQVVVLQAYSQDARFFKQGLVLTEDAEWTRDKPYVIYDSLVVAQGVTLTVQEGTTIYLHDKALIDVYGTLKLQGTADLPVRIRGDRLDKIIGISYNKLPGSWQGIRFRSSSYHNRIEFAHIRNGLFGISCDSSAVDIPKLSLSNTVLTNVYNHLLQVENCLITAVNCEFSNAGGALLQAQGGKYSFTHCTFANYFIWGSRSAYSVQLSNYKTEAEDKTLLPLLAAHFYNCIVYGSAARELLLDPLKEPVGELPFDYQFTNCLLKMRYEDSNTSQFTDCLFSKDPKFVSINHDTYNYIFRLQEESPAIDQGDDTHSSLIDLEGLPRPSGEKPDMGAYEWYPSQE